MKRTLALLLSTMLFLTALAGCAMASNNPPKLTYWVELNGNLTTHFTNLGDTPFAKGLMEKTGIDVEFQHPPVGQKKDQFNLMIASGDLPDIIEYGWLNEYLGGPEKAIADGHILRLNDVIDKYCPNLKQYLADNPDVDKMIRTDSGSYYGFPFIRGARELQTSVGPIVRGDWLKDFGMEAPVTLADWHQYLSKARDEKGATAPYTYIDWLIAEQPFAYAYGIKLGFYLDENGKVQYGPYTPAYKDFLTLMNQWYLEKLIDPDIATMNQTDIITAKMTNGNSAAIHGYAGSGIGTYMNTMKDVDPNYSLAGTLYPVINEGDTPKLGHIENKYVPTFAAAITTSCKNIEAAARLLDFAYSPEGQLYYNFGVEGVSYTMVDGQPVYTDVVLKNPDGWSIGESLAAHVRGSYNGPLIQDVRYIWQFLQLPQQVEAYQNWAKTDAEKYVMPPVSATPEESSELAAIMSEVDAYFREMYYKFMFGTESLDNFDKYMENMKGLGIDRALEIQEAALARYNAR